MVDQLQDKLIDVNSNVTTGLRVPWEEWEELWVLMRVWGTRFEQCHVREGTQ